MAYNFICGRPPNYGMFPFSAKIFFSKTSELYTAPNSCIYVRRLLSPVVSNIITWPKRKLCTFFFPVTRNDHSVPCTLRGWTGGGGHEHTAPPSASRPFRFWPVRAKGRPLFPTRQSFARIGFILRSRIARTQTAVVLSKIFNHSLPPIPFIFCQLSSNRNIDQSGCNNIIVWRGKEREKSPSIPAEFAKSLYTPSLSPNRCQTVGFYFLRVTFYHSNMTLQRFDTMYYVRVIVFHRKRYPSEGIGPPATIGFSLCGWVEVL